MQVLCKNVPNCDFSAVAVTQLHLKTTLLQKTCLMFILVYVHNFRKQCLHFSPFLRVDDIELFRDAYKPALLNLWWWRGRGRCLLSQERISCLLRTYIDLYSTTGLHTAWWVSEPARTLNPREIII